MPVPAGHDGVSSFAASTPHRAPACIFPTLALDVAEHQKAEGDKHAPHRSHSHELESSGEPSKLSRWVQPPRATADLDLAIAISPLETLELAKAFEDFGWKAKPYGRKTEQLRLTRQDLPRVDCIIATNDFERSAIERATTARIEGASIPVLLAEDLIVFKLMAGRARDYEAVAAIINAKGGQLDSDYVKAWLDQFGIPGAWDRAVVEADLEAEN